MNSTGPTSSTQGTNFPTGSMQDSDQENYIDQLPTELVLQIFSELEDPALLNVSLTCKLWRVLACDPSLYQQKIREFFSPLPKDEEVSIRDKYFNARIQENRILNPRLSPQYYAIKISDSPIKSLHITNEGTYAWAASSEAKKSELVKFTNFEKAASNFDQYASRIFLANGQVYFIADNNKIVTRNLATSQDETLIESDFLISSQGFAVTNDKIYVVGCDELMSWDIKTKQLEKLPFNEFLTNFEVFDGKAYYSTVDTIGIIEEGVPKKLVDVEDTGMSPIFAVRDSKIISWGPTLKVFNQETGETELEIKNQHWKETSESPLSPQIFGKFLFIVTKDQKSLKIFNLDNFGEIRTLKSNIPITSFTKHNYKIYLGLENGKIDIMDFSVVSRAL